MEEQIHAMKLGLPGYTKFYIIRIVDGNEAEARRMAGILASRFARIPRRGSSRGGAPTVAGSAWRRTSGPEAYEIDWRRRVRNSSAHSRASAPALLRCQVRGGDLCFTCVRKENSKNA